MWNPANIWLLLHCAQENETQKQPDKKTKKTLQWDENIFNVLSIWPLQILKDSAGLCGILDFRGPRCLSLAELALHPIVTEHFLILLKMMICSFTDGETVAASLSQASLTVNYSLFT